MTHIHILVAEDDDHIRIGLVDILESESYRVTQAAHGKKAMERFKENRFDLILLDIMMPEKSGYDVCRDIRAIDPQVPIIMLTAKGEEMDKVIGLHSGADDYITKPFGIHELLARITAVLRRSGLSGKKNANAGKKSCDDASTGDVFSFGNYLVNPKTFKLTPHPRAKKILPSPQSHISNQKNKPVKSKENTNKAKEVGGEKSQKEIVGIDITERELRLIQFFHRHPGEVLSRDTLLNEIWGINYLGTTRTLDQHIAKLRKKIESNPSCPGIITTVHGVGYRYVQ
ncbi:DNA-binding response regulator, OmpR family, contains REC and winged-helix (wHTH) domain [Desulfocicer vacuolatum DSM 3385]|uniref:DNA-binding response regulator, OmpR family, contains REC and winged-helix (WHTH) domain n=1 Tax=Desulfocicer vacuolatum DSM 3385 TaxID=1121400 RepID=A0A1W2BIP7_9BACT|nr:response regulator transcription factor [Desulfocicer vacuolatum]SMC72318.1 DNA-binding response regulator, OmpR family, contains REC and winged-helix (wHTH) domain [Desulfocicer vacuolatum DSM 3385]